MNLFGHYFAISVIDPFFFTLRKRNFMVGNSYPRRVSITYRVSSKTASGLTVINYENETGGLTTLHNRRLPFTKTITKTVNRLDGVKLAFGDNSSQDVKIEIAINGRIVKSQESAAVYGAVIYVFK